MVVDQATAEDQALASAGALAIHLEVLALAAEEEEDTAVDGVEVGEAEEGCLSSPWVEAEAMDVDVDVAVGMGREMGVVDIQADILPGDPE